MLACRAPEHLCVRTFRARLQLLTLRQSRGRCGGFLLQLQDQQQSAFRCQNCRRHLDRDVVTGEQAVKGMVAMCRYQPTEKYGYRE